MSRGHPNGGQHRLLTPQLLRLFAMTLGGLASFWLLLPVVPMYATAGGAGTRGAGLTTGALLLATVAAELAVPWLAARFGNRVLLAASLLLLGLPGLALAGSASLLPVLAICVVRGFGFGVLVVLGSALVAALAPPARRGEALGLYGLVIGLPSVLALPFGLLLVGRVGYLPVFVVAATAAVVAVAAVPGLPDCSGERGTGPARPGQPSGSSPRPGSPAALGFLAGLRTAALLRPALVFAATAVGAGAVVTFVPLAVGNAELAAVALLVQALTTSGARWWAGRYGDRRGPARLVMPGLLASAAGVLLLTLVSQPAVLLLAVAVFGAGFGASQNASLALMFSRVPAAGYGTASALWNVAFDAGMGLGAVGFGVLAAATGYPAGFAATGLIMTVMLVPALIDWRRPAIVPVRD